MKRKRETVKIDTEVTKRACNLRHLKTEHKSSGQITPVRLKPTLHQKHMVQFALNRCSSETPQGSILAAEMGVGKTAASLMTAKLLWPRHQRTCLFLCTVTLIDNVVQEVAKFFQQQMKVVPLYSSDEKTFDEDTFLVVTNRETLSCEQLRNYNWGTIIVDEAHDFRNATTLRYKNVLQLNAYNWILLTGTPVNNAPHEIVSLLEQARLVTVPPNMSHNQFMIKYKEEVLACIQGGCLRIDYEPDCAIERIVVPVTLSDEEMDELHERMKSGFCSPLSLFTQEINKCAASASKIPALEEIIRNYDPQRKLVVMSSLLKMQAIVKQLCQKHGLTFNVIDGSVVGEKRGQVEKSFREGEFDVLICSIDACKNGLNLQTAADMVITDYRSANPYDNIQAERRIWRQGQTRDVRVWYLVCEQTLESYIILIHQEKLKKAREVMCLIPKPSDYKNGVLSIDFIRESTARFNDIIAKEISRERRKVEKKNAVELVDIINSMFDKDGEYIGLPPIHQIEKQEETPNEIEELWDD